MKLTLFLITQGKTDSFAYDAPKASDKASLEDLVDRPLPKWIRLPVVLLLVSARIFSALTLYFHLVANCAF